MKILAFLLFVLPISGFSQSFDSWKGLKLDETTPAAALEKFAGPKADKSGEGFRPLKYDEWFIKDKAFRLLHYENIEGFSDVKLYFRDDKLVVIHIEPQKLKASLLPQTYNVEFEILISGMNKDFYPNNTSVERGKNYPKKFPVTYYLMHKAERSIFFVFVGNSGLKSVLGGSDDINSFPGEAKQIQMISKTLQNNKGSDLLK